MYNLKIGTQKQKRCNKKDNKNRDLSSVINLLLSVNIKEESKDEILKMKSYTLIEFSGDSSKRKKSVDCVPSNWIFFDEKEKKLKTPFLPPPYTISKRCQQFHDIVKAKGDPDSKWVTCNM